MDKEENAAASGKQSVTCGSCTYTDSETSSHKNGFIGDVRNACYESVSNLKDSATTSEPVSVINFETGDINEKDLTYHDFSSIEKGSGTSSNSHYVLIGSEASCCSYDLHEKKYSASQENFVTNSVSNCPFEKEYTSSSENCNIMRESDKSYDKELCVNSTFSKESLIMNDVNSYELDPSLNCVNNRYVEQLSTNCEISSTGNGSAFACKEEDSLTKVKQEALDTTEAPMCNDCECDALSGVDIKPSLSSLADTDHSDLSRTVGAIVENVKCEVPDPDCPTARQREYDSQTNVQYQVGIGLTAGVDYSRKLFSEMQDCLDNVVDLTNDDVDCTTNVRFSSKKKKKKKKKDKDKKKKKKDKHSSSNVANFSQIERPVLFRATGKDDFIIIERSLNEKPQTVATSKLQASSAFTNPLPFSKQGERSRRERNEVNYNEEGTDSEDEDNSDKDSNGDPEFSSDKAKKSLSPMKESHRFSCDKCTRTYQTKFRLMVHQHKAHNNKVGVECIYCHNYYTSAESLKSHQKRCKRKVEGKPKPFVCEFCSRSFLSMPNLRKHQSVMNCGMKLKYTCSLCGQSFNGQLHLDIHMSSHSLSESAIICPVKECGMKIENLRSFRSHLRIQHQAPPFPCPYCSREFSDFGNMSRHMKLHLDVKDYKCDECGREFTDYTGLVSHVRHNHTKEKPYKCQQCEREFYMKSDLNRHVATKHSDVRNHKCPQCGKAFKSYGGLMQHMKRETGEKHWQCGVCQKTFFSKSALEGHMITHTDLKLYSCELCGRRFAHLASLTAHVRAHSGIQPYHCRFCSCKFSHQSNRRRHEKTVHADIFY